MKLLLSPAPAAVAPAGGAPSTPAAAPAAAPSKPASAPAPEKSAEKPPAKGNMFDDLEAELNSPPTAKEPEAKKPEDGADPKQLKKEDEPAKESVKPADPKKPEDRQMTGPKELRDYAKRLEGERNALSAKLAELEKKAAAADEAGKSKDSLTNRVVELEKQLAEKEARLYALDVEQSPEFKKQYVAPFDKAAAFAQKQIEGLEITEQGPEGTEPKVREATWDDFIALYKMPFNKAYKVANAVFGPASQIVLNHMTELQRLDGMRQEAAREARDGAAQKRKAEEDARVASESKKSQQKAALWVEYNKDIEARHVEFQPDPQDAKEKTIIEKSAPLVDAAFGDRAGQTIEQQTLLDAEIRHRAIREPLLRYRLKKAANEIAELKGVIEEMKSGRPGDTKNPGGQKQEAKAKGVMEELAELTDD